MKLYIKVGVLLSISRSVIGHYTRCLGDWRSRLGDSPFKRGVSRYKGQPTLMSCKIEKEKAYIQDWKQRHARENDLTVSAGNKTNKVKARPCGSLFSTASWSDTTRHRV